MSKNQDINSLKRAPKDKNGQEEDAELINSKKKMLLEVASKVSKYKSEQGGIDYEESFRRHLQKEKETLKNIEMFNKNVGEKICYDQNFSEMLMEMLNYLETNDPESLANYQSKLAQTQEFLTIKSKEPPFESKTGDPEETDFKNFIETEKMELESKEIKLKEAIKELEKSINEEEEISLTREREIEIYKEMTNLSIEMKETADNSEIYECEIKNMKNPERYLKFELIIHPENEIQYLPIKINVDVHENHELEEEMFFDASQNDHFMALIYKIVNRDLVS